MGTSLMGERTRQQTLRLANRVSYNPLAASYATYRTIAKHPTVAMARALASMPILAGKWSVTADDDAPDDWVKLVQDEVVRQRGTITKHAALARLNYGFAPFELVWGLSAEGYMTLVKVKPLIQDPTSILVDERTGAMIGLLQEHVDRVELGAEKMLLVAFAAEGTDWYGNPLMANVVDPYNWWMECNEGAQRYDGKIAGSRIVVHYPLGKSLDADGNEQDNLDLAQVVLESLESAGSVCVPKQSADSDAAYGANAGEDQWSVDVDDAGSGQQSSFIARLEYLDKLLARALLCPERSIQEGNHGTLAEAEAHGDVALAMCELADQEIVDAVNAQVVDRVLTVNHGPDAAGKVRIERAPLADNKKAMLSQLYTSFLANPSGFLAEADKIDTDAIKDVLGIPKAQEVAQAGEPDATRPGVDAHSPNAATLRRIYREAANE